MIYFHISESYYGNLKDLVIYTICSFNLKRIVIHLHGGSIGKKLFEKNPIIYSLNKFFLSRVKTIILTGPSHSDIFSSFISQEKIKYVYNFAQDEFFLTPQGVTVKFSREQELNLLFLSTISEMKGYGVLLDAFDLLQENEQSLIRINFAGPFENKLTEELFLNRIKGNSRISYHGSVSGDLKRRLLFEADIFCLPSFHLEGQPISILEAYASGCFVITTNLGGTVDIFKDNVNGSSSSLGCPESIANLIRDALSSRAKISEIGAHNNLYASRLFTLSNHISNMHRILKK